MFDRRRVQSWWDYVEDHDTMKAPFLATGRGGETPLMLLATDHTNDPRSLTYAMISDVVRPDTVTGLRV